MGSLSVTCHPTQVNARRLSIQYVYYFRAYQRQRTLHGVRVITKLYFAIFAEFKKSMILNLAHRLFKVIHFGGNQKPEYDFRSIFNRFGDIVGFIRPSQLCK